MKKLTFAFYRAIGYAGLYAEIFSATCRWVSKGRRESWRTVVTEALVAAGYLPLTRQQLEAAEVQYRIICQNESLRWQAKQPQTIQTCLQVNKEAYAKTLKSGARIEKREWVPEDRIRPNAEFWDRYYCVPKF